MICDSVLSNIIAAIATLISAIAVVVAIRENRKSQTRYEKSIEPQLSMRLVNYNDILYLIIKNTGKTAAKDVKITINKLCNNGRFEMDSEPTGLVAHTFELYPEEVVQDMVAMVGASIQESVYPQLSIAVNYLIDGKKGNVSYARTITYCPAYDNKVVADVNLDMKGLDSSLNSIARSSVRTANYLDGCQLAAFDERNILTRKSLGNDLREALGKSPVSVVQREDAISK